MANKACMCINHTPITFLWWVPFGTCIKQCLLLYFVIMVLKVTKFKLQILKDPEQRSSKKTSLLKICQHWHINNNTDVNGYVWSLVIPKWYSTWTKQFCHDKTDKHLSRQTCSNISGRVSANNSTIKLNSINMFPIILAKDQAPFVWSSIHGHTSSVVHPHSYITIHYGRHRRLLCSKLSDHLFMFALKIFANRLLICMLLLCLLLDRSIVEFMKGWGICPSSWFQDII